jgi:DNA-binding Lrp family transcriptional regulator
MGRIFSRMLIRLHEPSKENYKTLLNTLSSCPDVHWVASFENEYDFEVVFSSETVFNLEKSIEKMLAGAGQLIKETEFGIAKEVYYFDFNYLYEKPNPEFTVLKNKRERTELARNETLVLSSIAENSRKPTVQVAGECKLSVPTVKKIISLLKKKGVINGFRIRIDARKLGFGEHLIIIKLNSADPSLQKRIIGNIAKKKGTTYIFSLISGSEIEARCTAKSHEDVHSMMLELRKEFPKEIGAIEECMLKEVYNLNTVLYSKNYPVV